MNPVKNNLVALGTAAVLTVYAAGFLKTKAAADQFDAEEAAHARSVAGAPTVSADVPHPLPSASVVENSPAAILPKPETSKSGKVTPVAPPSNDAATITTTTTVVTKVVDTAPAPVVEPVATPAPAPMPVAPPIEKPVPVVVNRGPYAKDGAYSGWGTSRHGDIQATVEIKDGYIVAAYISSCQTRYPCSRVSILPPQVIARQSFRVDYVSGATQSSDAFAYAISDALSKSK